MAKKQALGRGLSALIDDAEREKLVQKVAANLEINIDDIELNPFQPRTRFDEQLLEELASSIRKLGIIQPLTVREIDGDRYQLIAGERRLNAAKLLQINNIPALVREATDEESLELALIENLQRENLNPIEQAKAYQYLINKFGITQERLAQIVGKARASISNILRLLKLPQEVQDEIKVGRLTFAHARALLELEEPITQKQLTREIIANSLSVNELENLIRSRKKKVQRRKKQLQAGKDPYLLAIEEQMQQILGTKVKISQGRKRGFIYIEFYSKQDLERIFNTLHG